MPGFATTFEVGIPHGAPTISDRSAIDFTFPYILFNLEKKNPVLKTIFFLLLSGICIVQFGQSTSEVLEKADRLRDEFKEAEALKQYLKILEKDPDNLDALISASFLSSREGFRKTNKNEKIILYEQGKALADRAMSIDSQNAEVNYVMGVAMGRIAEISPTKQKIEASKDVKKYAERAIQYDRTHPGAWHLLGKWHYGVKELSATKIFLINLIYGGMPRASYETAVDCYNKAINYRPDYILYRLDLAKAYIQLGQKNNARTTLEEALKMKPTIPDDPTYLKECQELLQGLY